MTDPFVCPRGHFSVELMSRRFRCKTCEESWPKADLVDLRVRDPPREHERADATVGEDVVLVLPGQAGDRYHTDPDCGSLSKSDREAQSVRVGSLDDRDLDPCSRCLDGVRGGNPPGVDSLRVRRQLLAADPDAVLGGSA